MTTQNPLSQKQRSFKYGLVAGGLIVLVLVSFGREWERGCTINNSQILNQAITLSTGHKTELSTLESQRFLDEFGIDYRLNQGVKLEFAPHITGIELRVMYDNSYKNIGSIETGVLTDYIKRSGGSQ